VLGQTLRVGTQASGQLARRAAAEAAGNFAATTTGGLAQGQSLEEALGTGARSAGLGVLGTAAGGLARTPAGQSALEFGVGGLVTSADIVAQGGSTVDVLQNLTVQAATRGALSRSPGHQRQFAELEQRGAAFTRSVQSRTRSTVAAIGIGLHEVPALRPGFGGTGAPLAAELALPGAGQVSGPEAGPAAPRPVQSPTTAASTEAAVEIAPPASQAAAVEAPAAVGQAPIGAAAVQSPQQAPQAAPARRESAGARATQQGIAAHEAAIQEQERLGFLQPGTHRGATASAQTARSITTGVRADVAEVMTYNARLVRGEIGILAPVGSNIPGPDSATAVRLPNGDYEIVVVDTKSRVSAGSRFGQVRSALPPSWQSAVDDALAPGRLDLGDPALEAAIRDAWDQGRVRVARDTVDFSPTGQGDLRLDN
jgi:hypothetical protein